ncbi:MAG: DUF4238 domain-containing protein [Acidimicrobiaceae bacterium]|nr:DUF4238 domain-containing protein [Acidimicrobiaceae bacterium]MYI36985.1 DUF4238 domain-containing protein [Acidimicrobiaceae bacterium]
MTGDVFSDDTADRDALIGAMACERLVDMGPHWEEAHRSDNERPRNRRPRENLVQAAGPDAPRDQHYVPEFWLKKFAQRCERELVVAAIDGTGVKARETVSTDRAATEPHFYTLTMDSGESTVALEGVLGLLEGDAAPAFKQMAKGRLPDSWLKRFEVSFLLAAQLIRTPASLRPIQQAMSDVARRIIEMAQMAGELPPIPGGFEVEVDQQSAMGALWSYETLDECAFYFFCRRWSLVEAAEGSCGFVLPERPVVMYSARSAWPYGPGGALNAHEVWVPVSRRQLLVMHWVDSPGGKREALSDDRVQAINRYLETVGGPMVFCHPSDARSVEQMVAEQANMSNPEEPERP